MSNAAIELKKRLLANIAVINFLESEIATANKSKTSTIQSIYLALVDEVNANLAKIHPEFNNYLSRTIANFRSLNECYYYKGRPGTETVTIENYLFDILRSGITLGRVNITLPTYGLPKKAFIAFFKDLGVTVTKSKGMLIFTDEISKAKGDEISYVCFHMNFREI